MKSIIRFSAFILFLITSLTQAQATLSPNKWVYIESKVSRLHLDVKMGSKAAKTLVWMYSQNGSTAQQWMLQNAGGGYYYIKSRRSGLYLDVKMGSRKSGAFIWQYPKNGSDAQKWKAIPAGGGYYYLQAKISGLYLDVRGGSTKIKAQVWQHPLNRTNAQKWKMKLVKSKPPGRTTIPGRIALPESLRPAFEKMPVWRLQLAVTTSGNKNANTDSPVYVKFHNRSGSAYYLNKSGDDRERHKTDVYDILDPNIRSISDIGMLQLVIKGNDGWCVQKVELLVNGVKQPIFRKYFGQCKWLDGDSGSGRTLHIGRSELRRHAGWRHTSRNKAIWLPPSIIRRAALEQMVESYVGHMMEVNPDMKKLKFGKKYGRAYVEAKKAGKNKLHFDLDLAYNKAKIDFETDVDFDLVVNCRNNKISLSAQSVKGKLNIPVISRLVRLFKSDFAKMNMGNMNFGNANVPFCPNIKVTANGDISFI